MSKITWEDSIESFVSQASSSSPTPGVVVLLRS